MRTVLGSVELDLRASRFEADVTEIRIHAVLGNIEMRFPKGVRLENYAKNVIASFESREEKGRGRGAPSRARTTSPVGTSVDALAAGEPSGEAATSDRDPQVVRIVGRAVLSSVTLTRVG